MNNRIKNDSHFIRHGLSLESPLANQQTYLTPVERFFVCNSGTSPHISPSDYSLRIWGDGVSRELKLSYADLEALPRYEVPAILECAGNHRSLFRDVMGTLPQTPKGTTELIWSTGAVGMALWSGVRLADVLNTAGIDELAVHVCPSGSERDSCEGVVKLPLPVSKAMDPDTLLALTMNGEPLTRDHGAPVRMLVPGWIGAYSVKWVQDIEVSKQRIWVRRNTTSYVMIGEEWPSGHYEPALGKPITTTNIKSSLALPWPARLSAGEQPIHGYARSPGVSIASVQWSEDEGESWKEAALVSDNEPYGWVRFEFTWHAKQGDSILMTKAIDENGDCQPDSVPLNKNGYLYNAIHPHPIHVTD